MRRREWAVLAILLVIGEALLDWPVTTTTYWKFFGLSGDNTAYDYLSASKRKRQEFAYRKCNDGVCLSDSDWDCGFTTDTAEYMNWDENVDKCFEELVRVVPMHTSLHKVRTICGRRYMQFFPYGVYKTGSKEKCEAGKRQWGVKTKLWTDEAELLAKAGVQ
jgi:hypothetical protein